jgi:hypothetical protein
MNSPTPAGSLPRMYEFPPSNVDPTSISLKCRVVDLEAETKAPYVNTPIAEFFREPESWNRWGLFHLATEIAVF